MAQPSGWVQVVLGTGVGILLLGVGLFYSNGIRSIAAWTWTFFGILVVGFSLLSHYDVWSGAGQKHPVIIIGLAGAAGFLLCGGIAAVLIWASTGGSHSKRHETATTARPVLRAEVTSIAIGGRAVGVPKLPGPFLTVFVRVVNTGAPTIVTGWQVTAVYENGGVLKTYPFLFTSATKTITFGSEIPGGAPVIVSPEDDLASKTSQDAIPSGGARVGHLVTYFEDPNADWRAVRWIRISFSDVTGTTYQAEADRKKGRTDFPPGGVPNLPGLRRPGPNAQ